MSFDPRCKALAEVFLVDESYKIAVDENVERLAQAIQDTIEGQLETFREEVAADGPKEQP
jgi:hypothetical protein